MIHIKIKTKGFKNYRMLMKAYGPMRVHKAIKYALKRVAEAVVREAKVNLTKNKTRVFSLLFGSLWYKVEHTSKGLVAKVGPGLLNKSNSYWYGDPMNYGYFVEYGRGPGGMPPKGAIKTWAKRKLGITNPKTIFLIRRGIALRGTKTTPAPFLGPALEKAEKGGAQRIFENALNKALQDIDRRDIK